MLLGQSLGEFVEAIRDRVEVSRGDETTWRVTTGSFESAMAYVRKRFGEPVVLSRRDRAGRWPRVTIEISTDPARALAAPQGQDHAGPADTEFSELPPSLEAIFASQGTFAH